MGIDCSSVFADENQNHELHAIEAANGTIVAQIRNHNAANNRETLQSESTDGGKTWSNVLFINELTGASELSIDYNNPNV